MLEIEFTSQFKRDLKKHYMALLTLEWAEVMSCLASDRPLPEKYKDHALIGEWKDYRDCHIKPDLVLIYSKSKTSLRLVRLGSHSELF